MPQAGGDRGTEQVGYHRGKDCQGKATPKFGFCISQWQRVTAETSAIAGPFVGR